ncbi:MAG: outer membrane lipoprotein chaperone LolA [Pseudomonadota bacterium]|nr:outer membrane lipoprotein chaperone LolA [Pseudomonadota bacterium]
MTLRPRWHLINRLSLWLWGLLVASAAVADPTAELVARLDANTSLEGRFSQEVRGSDGMTLQRTEGRFWAARPERFRWEVKGRFAQLLVSDGTRIWHYDPDLQQVIVRPYAGRLTETPALLLSGGSASIREAFRVVRTETSHGQEAGFTLYPRQQDGLIEALELVFSGDHLQRMRVWDGLGQMTLFEFSELRLNPTLDPGLFVFEPPPGTDVIADG